MKCTIEAQCLLHCKKTKMPWRAVRPAVGFYIENKTSGAFDNKMFDSRFSFKSVLLVGERSSFLDKNFLRGLVPLISHATLFTLYTIYVQCEDRW